MDNELSNSVHIAINLMVISVVLGILMMFTNLGQSFKRDALDNVAAMQADTYASDLIESANHGAMPAASVFVLLQRNEHLIRSVTGTAYAQVITQADDLLPLLDKKVRITVSEVNGLYDVTVWEDCSCKNPTMPST